MQNYNHRQVEIYDSDNNLKMDLEVTPINPVKKDSNKFQSQNEKYLSFTSIDTMDTEGDETFFENEISFKDKENAYLIKKYGAEIHSNSMIDEESTIFPLNYLQNNNISKPQR